MGCNTSTPKSLASSQLATNASTATATGSALVTGNSGTVVSSPNVQGATSTTNTSRIHDIYQRIFGENIDVGQPSYAGMFTEGAKKGLTVLMQLSVSLPFVGVAAQAVLLCIESAEAFQANKSEIGDITKQISFCVELIARFSKFVEKLPSHNSQELESSLSELSQAIDELTKALSSIKDQSLVLQAILPESIAASLHKLFRNIEDCREEFNFQLHEVEFECMIDQRQRQDTKELHSLLSKYGPIETSFMKDINLHLEHFVPGTRVWMREEVIKWMDEVDGSQLFWIQAEAGMGKSVFAASLVRELDPQGRLAACFFCKYGDSTRSKEESMVLSLAYQIAIRFPECSELILTALQKLDMSSGESVANKMVSLLFNPLNNVQKSPPVVIVVDALDEIGIQHSKERESMLTTLVSCVSNLKWVKFLITARPDDDIARCFDPFQPVLIRKYDERHVGDLRRFVAAKVIKMNISVVPDGRSDAATIGTLEQDRQQSADELMTAAVDVIVERSEGRFIYVALVAKDVFKVNCTYTMEQLKSVLPKGLDEVYLTNFQRMRNDSGVRRYNEVIRPLLGMLLVAREPFKVDDLQLLLGCSDCEMNELIHLVRSMFPVVGDETFGKRFSVFHKSVADWLLDKEKSHSTAGSEITLYWLQERLQDIDVSDLKNYLSELQKEYLSCFENLAFVCRDGASCNPIPLPVFARFRLYDYIMQMKLVSDWSGEKEAKYDFYVDRSGGYVEISKCMLRFIGLEPPLGPHLALAEPLNLQPNSIPSTCSYLLKHMIHHLVNAEYVEIARALLLQLPWLLACIEYRERGVYDVLEDMRYVLSVQQGDQSNSPTILFEAGGQADTSFEDVFKAMKLSASAIRTASSSRQRLLLFVLHLVWRLRSLGEKTSICVEELLSACLQWLEVEYNTKPLKYELLGGRLLHTLHVGDVLERKNICLKKDGDTLVALPVRGVSTAVMAWSLFDGKPIRSPKELTFTATSICMIDAEDRTIVAASVKSTIKFWDIDASMCLQTITAHDCEEIVSLCSVSIGSESFVISLAADYEIKMWSCLPVQFMKTLQKGDPHMSKKEVTESTTLSLYASFQGSYFVSTLNFKKQYSDFTCKLWDAGDGVLLNTVNFSRDIGVCCHFTLIGDGSILVFGTKNGEIKVWDLKLNKCLQTLEGRKEGHKRGIRNVLSTPDGCHLLSQCWDGVVTIWNTKEWGAKVNTIKEFREDCVFISNDLLALTLNRKFATMNVHSLSSDAHEHREKDTNTRISVACISPDDSFVVSGSDDGTLKVWDAKSGECTRTVEGTGRIVSLAISSDCRRIMSLSEDIVSVWDHMGGLNLLSRFSYDSKCLRKPIMSQNTGHRVLFPSGGYIKLWLADTPSKTDRLNYEGDIMSFNSMCLSEDGSRIVIGSKVVQVWNADSRELIETLDIYENNKDDNDDIVVFVRISSDCKRIVAVSAKALVTVWNLSSNGHFEHTFTTTEETVRGAVGGKHSYIRVFMSRDGRNIVIKREKRYTICDVASSTAPRIELQPEFDVLAYSVDFEINGTSLSIESFSLLPFFKLYCETINFRNAHLSNKLLVVIDSEKQLQIFRCSENNVADASRCK